LYIDYVKSVASLYRILCKYLHFTKFDMAAVRHLGSAGGIVGQPTKAHSISRCLSAWKKCRYDQLISVQVI